MNIAVYTRTRDRLDYTKLCFDLLRSHAGVPFDHFVLDNGSTDGTQEWLERKYRPYLFLKQPKNEGISRGSNMVLDAIFYRRKYDLVCKFDNDCEVISENILGQMTEIYSDVKFGPRYILSPRVEGIVHQPTRVRYTMLAGRRIGLTAIVGGLFHVVPAAVYSRYRYPEALPPGKGQDDHFCDWARRSGCEVGYVEGLIVNHYRGTDQQAQDYPEYFERKWREESA